MAEYKIKEKKIAETPKRGLLKVIIFVSIFLLGGGGVYYLAKEKPELLGLAGNTSGNQSEVNLLVSEVGKLITLPEGENPTIATVTDVEKVKDQPFFKNAKTGDRVLVYSQSKKAYLYRPSEKKLIEVGAVNIGKEQVQNAPTSSPILSISPAPTSLPTETPIPTSTPTTTQPSN